MAARAPRVVPLAHGARRRASGKGHSSAAAPRRRRLLRQPKESFALGAADSGSANLPRYLSPETKRCWSWACSPSIERTNGRVGEESIFGRGWEFRCPCCHLSPPRARGARQPTPNSFSCKPPSAASSTRSAPEIVLRTAARSCGQLLSRLGSATNSREDTSLSIKCRSTTASQAVPGAIPRIRVQSARLQICNSVSRNRHAHTGERRRTIHGGDRARGQPARQHDPDRRAGGGADGDRRAGLRGQRVMGVGVAPGVVGVAPGVVIVEAHRGLRRGRRDLARRLVLPDRRLLLLARAQPRRPLHARAAARPGEQCGLLLLRLRFVDSVRVVNNLSVLRAGEERRSPPRRLAARRGAVHVGPQQPRTSATSSAKLHDVGCAGDDRDPSEPAATRRCPPPRTHWAASLVRPNDRGLRADGLAPRRGTFGRPTRYRLLNLPRADHPKSGRNDTTRTTYGKRDTAPSHSVDESSAEAAHEGLEARGTVGSETPHVDQAQDGWARRRSIEPEGGVGGPFRAAIPCGGSRADHRIGRC